MNDWKDVKVFDARTGSERMHCDLCGTKLRWVHVLVNSDGRRKQVGCCCAARLCTEYDAEAEERAAKNHAARRVRFLAEDKWRPSRLKPANRCRKVRLPGYGKITVTIYEQNGCWGVFLAGPRRDNYGDNARFATRDEAMEYAWILIERVREAEE